MNMPEFVALVEEMRAAQRGYFRCRDSKRLQIAIVHEYKVDTAIKEWKEQDKPKQGGLL